MNRLAHLAARLYPRWWRERYGAEFAALLEDARPGVAGALDIAKGAIAMRFTSPNPWRAFCLCLIAGQLAAICGYFTAPVRYESTMRMEHGGAAFDASGKRIQQAMVSYTAGDALSARRGSLAAANRLVRGNNISSMYDEGPPRVVRRAGMLFAATALPLSLIAGAILAWRDARRLARSI